MIWKISFHRWFHWLFSPLTLLENESLSPETFALREWIQSAKQGVGLQSVSMYFLAQFIYISHVHPSAQIILGWEKMTLLRICDLCIIVICSSFSLSCKEYFLNALTFHTLCSTWVPYNLWGHSHNTEVKVEGWESQIISEVSTKDGGKYWDWTLIPLHSSHF